MPPINQVHFAPLVATSEVSSDNYDANSVLSSLSLAVLDDSGWYRTHRELAEPLWWGRGQGSNFLLSYTVAPNKTYVSPYGCEKFVDHSVLACSYDRRYKGFCTGYVQSDNQAAPAGATEVISRVALVAPIHSYGSCTSGAESSVRHRLRRFMKR